MNDGCRGTSDPYNGINLGGFIPASELVAARNEGLLTAEEARQVYWSQFGQLRQQAGSTAPAIPAAA